MLVCFICNCEVARSVKNLFEHLKTIHGVHERHEKYCCRQGQCCRSFSERYSFSKHIVSCHSSDLDTDDPNVVVTCHQSVDDQDANVDLPVTENNVFSQPSQQKVKIDVTELASAFLCEAKSRTTSLSSVNAVVNSCKLMLEALFDDLRDELKTVAKNLNQSDGKQLEKVFSKFQQFRNPFHGLESEYSHAAYLELKGLYIKPVPYTIGSKQGFVSDCVTGVKKPTMESVSGQYISVSDTIKALNARTKLIESAVTKPKPAVDVTQPPGIYSSYFDGDSWNNHPLKNDDTLVIRLYGDDFEPANPLGSRKTLYKVCCIYFQLENLPSYILSKTENMFLTLCYHTGDVKEFGWRYVLRPLVNELKLLESSGIALVVNGTVRTYTVLISAVTGDNLFLNGILGFVESFTATHPCRHCNVSRSEFSHMLTEPCERMRDIASYNAALMLGSVSDTGIKLDSAFHELKYFHAAENHIQDIMHDVFEGVCAYDLPLICRALIHRKYFDLSQLNHRLQTFDYGHHDSSNKIPVLSSVDVEMWTYDACQLWCLTRVLSVAVGDLVEETDEVWLFYLSLRNIMDIILAPSVQEDQLHLLAVFTSEYLEKRLLLFPEKSIKNKHHHLVHYAGLIRKIGPLVRFWCMRFESKHQHSKRVLHVSGNFKNVLQTIAVRHQYDFAFRLLRNHCDDNDVVVGTGEVVTLAELGDGSTICSTLGNIGMMFELYNAKWIEVRGIRYKPGDYILTTVKCGVPVFMHVQNIFIRSPGDHVWLYGKQLVTNVFSGHYHAWIVEKQVLAEPMCYSPLQLIYPVPVVINAVKKQDKEISLIGLRYHV